MRLGCFADLDLKYRTAGGDHGLVVFLVDADGWTIERKCSEPLSRGRVGDCFFRGIQREGESSGDAQALA